MHYRLHALFETIWRQLRAAGKWLIVGLELGEVIGFKDGILVVCSCTHQIHIPLAAILHFGPQFYGPGSAYVQSRNGSVDDLAVDLRPDAGVDESEHRRADL
jgi:hypothetical protein